MTLEYDSKNIFWEIRINGKLVRSTRTEFVAKEHMTSIQKAFAAAHISLRIEVKSI